VTDAQHSVAAATWAICKDVAKNIWIAKEPSLDYARAAACLLFGTAAQESDSFRARRQYGFDYNSDGGAFSLWQMERAAIENGLKQIKQSECLEDKVAAMILWGVTTTFEQAKLAIQRSEGDLFACILARLYYLRCPGAIPATIDGQGAYWKRYYNTVAGAGTVEQYIHHWNHCCADIVRDNP